jgi:hypothetical protein
MEPNAMAELVGPVYEASALATTLRRSTDDLASRASVGDLLLLHTADGVPVYPAFQFTATYSVRPDLIPVLRKLTDIEPWSVAIWLRTPNDDLADLTPDEALANGAQPTLVETLAEHWANILSA